MQERPLACISIFKRKMPLQWIVRTKLSAVGHWPSYEFSGFNLVPFPSVWDWKSLLQRAEPAWTIIVSNTGVSVVSVQISLLQKIPLVKAASGTFIHHIFFRGLSEAIRTDCPMCIKYMCAVWQELWRGEKSKCLQLCSSTLILVWMK